MGGSKRRTGRVGRPDPAGPAWADNPGSGPCAAVIPRARRPSGLGTIHRRGRRTCHAAAWPPVGADPAGTARAGDPYRAVAAPRTARCPPVAARRLPVAARRWEAAPGRARCPGGVVRYGAARPGMAAPGTARCRGAVARRAPAVRGTGRYARAAARRGAAVWKMRRCRGAVARRAPAVRETGRCPRAAARRGAAAWGMGRCPRGAPAGSARCGRTGARHGRAAHLARRRGPEGTRRRAAMARREERPPGLRRCCPNRRPPADKNRDRRGRCALAGAHPAAGLAPAARAPAHPTGRAAAHQRAHPQNPWRERILLSA